MVTVCYEWKQDVSDTFLINIRTFVKFRNMSRVSDSVLTGLWLHAGPDLPGAPLFLLLVKLVSVLSGSQHSHSYYLSVATFSMGVTQCPS